MMKSKSTESNAMKHEKNAELFASLENAKFQLAELRQKPEADAGAIRHWEKKHADIMNQLITTNQRLVKSIAAKLKDLEHNDELEQVGTIAMAKAIEKFDPELGNQFSTYAYQPIWGAMLRAINKNRTIQIPESKIGEVLALKKAIDKLRVEQGYETGEKGHPEPSLDDLAHEMNLPLAKVRDLYALLKGTISVNTGGPDNGEIIVSVAPTNEVELNDEMKLIWQAVGTLSKRDADVFLSGGGYFGHQEQSFEKIGSRHGFSRQRAQQIFDAAMAAVAAYMRSEKARCSGKIAKQRLGLDKKTAPIAAAKVGKSTQAATKPYRLKTRAVDKKNPNHHIWLNNGTWYCKFTLELANGETSTICNSFDTKDVMVARKMRDNLILLYNAPSWPQAA
jgi:RNA polymerase primary sigma factor